MLVSRPGVLSAADADCVHGDGGTGGAEGRSVYPPAATYGLLTTAQGGFREVTV